jgi:hypothetical protein
MSKQAVLKSVKFFFLYASEDRRIAETIKHYLTPLVKLGRIEIEDGSEIISGAEWTIKHRESFNEADVYMIFISPELMTSDFCYQDDLKLALEKQENKKAIVLPILVKMTPFWKELTIGKLDYLPIDGKAISQWKNEEEVLFDITKYIKKVIKKISGREEENHDEI